MRKKTRKKFLKYEASDLLKDASLFDGCKLLIKKLRDYEPKYLRELVREIANQDPCSITILINLADKLYVFGSAGEEAIKEGANIAKLIDDLKNITEGKGGGSPRLIQLLTDRKDKVGEVERYLRENAKKILEK